MREYDYIIIGGGIFGVYTSLYLAERKGFRVCLIEKENRLMRKATIVNQARLHCGYHYPRSIATARMSDEHRSRFERDHQQFINKSFNQYYAISRDCSFTSSSRFQAFCSHLNLQCTDQALPDFVNKDFVESVYLTEELTFDPIEMSRYYESRISNSELITLLTGTSISNVEKDSDKWVLYLNNCDNEPYRIASSNAVNATYFNTNHINKLFNQDSLDLVHELTEMVFFSSRNLPDVGMTVMDGPFAGFMPYGNSGINSLYSVLYSVHNKSVNQPQFPCQLSQEDCTPVNTSICNRCPSQPNSNKVKITKQIKRYLQNEIDIFYLQSMFTIRTKLKSSSIDDGRPTSIIRLSENPSYSLLLAGKINSIYEIEKFFN